MKAWILLTLASSALARSVFAQAYPIPPARSSMEGAELKVAISMATLIELELSRGQTAIKQERKDYTVDFQGTDRILEQNQTRATHSVIIDKLTKLENGVLKELLPPGSILNIVRQGKKKSIMQNGRPVNQDLGEILGTVLPVDSYGVTEEISFGSKEPKKVGDTWPIAPTWVQQFGIVNGHHSEGTATLEGVERSPGGDILELSVHSETNDAPPIANFVPDTADSKFSFRVKLPADPKRMPPRFEHTLETESTGHKDDLQGKLDFSMHTKWTKIQVVTAQ